MNQSFELNTPVFITNAAVIEAGHLYQQAHLTSISGTADEPVYHVTFGSITDFAGGWKRNACFKTAPEAREQGILLATQLIQKKLEETKYYAEKIMAAMAAT